MLEVVSWFAIALITHILDCYVFSKLINEKFKLNLKSLILIICFSIIDCNIAIFVNQIIKIIITNLITVILLLIIFRKSFVKSFAGMLFINLGYALSETIVAFLLIQLIGLSEKFLINNICGILFTNLLIFIIYILIINIKFLRLIISKFIKWVDDKKIFSIICISIFSISICYILIFQLSYNIVNSINDAIILLIVIISLIVYIYFFFEERTKNNRLNIEYDNLLEYSKTYEDEVVSKGKQQHEYRNQLIVLDDMIPKTNKKAKEYIKKILNSTEKELDKGWLVKLKGFPTGGIKGLIHFKIKKMIDNGIDVYVDVDKNLSKKKKWIYDNNVLEDISKIIGVYLDNAIEASMKSKDKQIIIEFTENENMIIFKLSNTYEGLIDFQHMDNERFSTKGKGRGYGLPLVKDIINKNNFLSQKREIDGKFFVQKLYMKIKK